MIGTFNSQELANTVNVLAKMDHHHPMLFDEVAKAAIPMTGTFKSQELANAVFTAFAKMDHHHPMLFDEVAKAAHSNDRCLQIARASKYSECICQNEPSSSKAVRLSCKSGHSNARCKSVHSNDRYLQIARASDEVVDRNDEHLLESIADVYNAILAGEHFNGVPSDFLTKLTQLAIEYSSQARIEDVRDILIGATRVAIRSDPLQLELYTKYRPLFERYRKDMPPYFRDSINETYEYLGLS
eukprot:scaffold1666_cov62-Cylindrotheca_fusiformis.AAC.1